MTAGRIPRPRKPGLPITGAVTAVVLWGVVAHDSGVGWVQATGTLVAGFLLVGLFAPALAVSRARCRVVSVPAFAWAGLPVQIEIATTTAVELAHGDSRAVSGADRRCRLELTPAHRGVATAVTVSLGSAAPFGFLWWERRITLTFPGPLVVAPRLVPGGQLRGESADGTPGDLGAARLEPHHEPRGVRPYEPGDRFHQVHWPASAHTGALMVRETEHPTGRPHIVTVDLPEEPLAAEQLAERHLGAITRMLAAGDRVELVTRDAGGEVRAPVTSPPEVGRRLATCLPPSDPWGTTWPG